MSPAQRSPLSFVMAGSSNPGEPIKRAFRPDPAVMDDLIELLVELVNLPDAAPELTCVPVTPMESCG